MSEKMLIRKFVQRDIVTRVEWVNNPKVYKSMHFQVPIDKKGTLNWLNKIKDSTSRFDVVFEEDDIVAMGGLTSIENYPTGKKAELYIFVNPSLQKGGIGTKATHLLCKYGFEKLGLSKIYLYTNSNNIAAQRVYEKVGFKRLGQFCEEAIDGDGKIIDRYYYEITKEDLGKQVVADVFLRMDDVCIDGQKLRIIRDDIFPFVGGGSKARKAIEYEIFLKENGYNAIVTCGGIQSNHNRAMALLAAKNGWKCHLCIQGTEKRFTREKGNALLCRLAGAECELIQPQETAIAMERAMEKLKEEGFRPYYVVGGGHNLPGGTSFVNAVQELKKRCQRQGYKPDYIFHASGTGSTQAGIAVGLDLVGWSDVKLIGISVARQYERGKQVIVDFANMLAKHYEMSKDYSDFIYFNSDYLCGGYENFTQEMKSFLDDAMKKSGIVFDTTYSGKAFFGMMDIIKKNNIQGNIIFWHTGGIMNIMA